MTSTPWFPTLVLILSPLALGAVVDNRVETEVPSGLAECGSRADVIGCLSVRAVAALDRAARMSDIPLIEGITLVKEKDFRAGRALLTPEQLERSLPQDQEERSSRLVDLMYDSALRFLQSHSINIKMPSDAPETFQRALEEGRAKIKKKILPILMLVGVKLMTLLPLALGAIGLMALKALFVGKLAFVIAAIIAFQKFFTGGASSLPISTFGKESWNTGSAGWSGAGSYSPVGGPYKRSMAAHDLAYSAQAPQADTNAQ